MDYFLSSSINFLRFIFFSGILPPEVKKMLCGDYGNNNDQENCLLKKLKTQVTLGFVGPFHVSSCFQKKIIFLNSTDDPEISRNFIYR